MKSKNYTSWFDPSDSQYSAETTFCHSALLGWPQNRNSTEIAGHSISPVVVSCIIAIADRNSRLSRDSGKVVRRGRTLQVKDVLNAMVKAQAINNDLEQLVMKKKLNVGRETITEIVLIAIAGHMAGCAEIETSSLIHRVWSQDSSWVDEIPSDLDDLASSPYLIVSLYRKGFQLAVVETTKELDVGAQAASQLLCSKNSSPPGSPSSLVLPKLFS